jgi:hypothetical protein
LEVSGSVSRIGNSKKDSSVSVLKFSKRLVEQLKSSESLGVPKTKDSFSKNQKSNFPKRLEARVQKFRHSWNSKNANQFLQFSKKTANPGIWSLLNYCFIHCESWIHTV